jgi:hypothetical protein
VVAVAHLSRRPNYWLLGNTGGKSVVYMDISQQFLTFVQRSLDVQLEDSEKEFNRMALALFGAQFCGVSIYRRFCEGRNILPEGVRYWRQIPAMPTAAFKEFEVSSIPTAERTAVF